MARVLSALAEAPEYAVDTEFHRERTYYPKLALLQLAWAGGVEADGSDGPGGEVVLVDPLRVDLRPLRAVLEGEGVAVLHAAEQDLEVLQQACGAVPARIFDTQIAAGFLGQSTPSLASLVAHELGVHLPKGDRMTDWTQRPLDEAQRVYAAADVVHLLELRHRLAAQLVERGRLAWAEQECEELRTRSRLGQDPDTAWWRVKEVRHLRGAARGVAQSVAAWRERKAAALDRPTRFVLPDLALVAIAGNPPRTLEQLRGRRGIDGRHLGGGAGREILGAVEDGLALPGERLRVPPVPDVDRRLRPAVALVSAWVAQLASDLHIETSLLATRADLTALLRGDADARLATGWRSEVVGEPARRLAAGEVALAFDGRGGLVLVPLDAQAGRSTNAASPPTRPE